MKNFIVLVVLVLSVISIFVVLGRDDGSFNIEAPPAAASNTRDSSPNPKEPAPSTEETIKNNNI
jgi:hypothetical protein